jgi:hypothetical protein
VARHAFAATIVKIGINPCVAVPPRVSRAFARRGYVPVKGALNHSPIRATLVPVGGGRHRLYLNTEMRTEAGVGVGDRVRVTLEVDTARRKASIPPELTAALRRNRTAARAFAAATPSYRRDILLYLNWLKTPESMQRNVRKVIAYLVRHRGRRRPGRGVPLPRPAGSYPQTGARSGRRPDA